MKNLILLQSTPTVTPTVPVGIQNNPATFKDYIPLIQSLVWPLFWLIVFLTFRKQIILLFRLILQQIEKGASVEVAGLKLTPGKLVEKTADLGDKVETSGNPDRFRACLRSFSG